jgi:hypothetical protein
MGESSQRLGAVLWAGVVRKVRSKSVVGRVSFILVGGWGVGQGDGVGVWEGEKGREITRHVYVGLRLEGMLERRWMLDGRGVGRGDMCGYVFGKEF